MFDFVQLIQVIAALIAFAVACVAFGSWSEHLGVLIPDQSQAYSILIEIYLFDFVLVIILGDFDCC